MASKLKIFSRWKEKIFTWSAVILEITNSEKTGTLRASALFDTAASNNWNFHKVLNTSDSTVLLYSEVGPNI